MSAKIFLYLIPLFPLILRGIIAVKFRDIRTEDIPKDPMTDQAYRGMLINFAGFCFAGLVGISILKEAEQLQKLELPMFYLLISFLCYFIAINIHSYKFYVSQDMMIDTLTDVAGISLVSSIISAVFVSAYNDWFKYLTLALAAVGWFMDHILRFYYTNDAYQTIRVTKRLRGEITPAVNPSANPQAAKGA